MSINFEYGACFYMLLYHDYVGYGWGELLGCFGDWVVRFLGEFKIFNLKIGFWVEMLDEMWYDGWVK